MYAFEYVFGYKLILKSIPEPDFDFYTHTLKRRPASFKRSVAYCGILMQLVQSKAQSSRREQEAE